MVLVNARGEQRILNYTQTIPNLEIGDYLLFRYPNGWMTVFKVLEFIAAPSGKLHFVKSLCIGGNKTSVAGKIHKLSIKDARLSDHIMKYENPRDLLANVFIPFQKRT